MSDRSIRTALPTDEDASRSNQNPTSSAASHRLVLYAALLAIDTASLVLGVMGTRFAYLGSIFNPTSVDILALLVPVFIFVSSSGRAYSIDALRDPKEGIRRGARALILTFAAIIGAVFYLKASAEFSRIVMAVGSGSSLILLCSGRWTFGRYIRKRYNGRFTSDLLLVDQVSAIPHGKGRMVILDPAKLAPSSDDPALLDRFGRLVRNYDRVILACPADRRAAWAAMVKGSDSDVEIIAPELDRVGALSIGRYGSRSTLVVNKASLSLRDRVIKRAFDLSISIPVLLLLLPVAAIVALAIKWETPGPVFFRQRRMGRGNRIFDVLKFRTMRDEASDQGGVRSASRDDDRITRVGSFLRGTSLDELPQLINVVMGHMSIVGPRPHALGSTAEDEFFWKIEGRYWERHAVKPGITGLAQVRGLRGATLQRSDLSNRVQADLEYLARWSLWSDIAIIIRTMKVMVHKNAF